MEINFLEFRKDETPQIGERDCNVPKRKNKGKYIPRHIKGKLRISKTKGKCLKSSERKSK